MKTLTQEDRDLIRDYVDFQVITSREFCEWRSSIDGGKDDYEFNHQKAESTLTSYIIQFLGSNTCKQIFENDTKESTCSA